MASEEKEVISNPGVTLMEDVNILGAVAMERPVVKLEEVAGLEEVKLALKESILLPLKFPQLFKGSRRPLNSCFLLYGPPGTGKTLVAKAIAAEADAASYFRITASDLASKFIDGIAIVQSLFRLARERKPSLIVLDDIEQVGQENRQTEVMKKVMIELINQMTDLEGIYIIGITNLPWTLHCKLRRKFIKRLYVSLPDAPARTVLFKHEMRTSAHSLTEENFRTIGELTERMSGSDIVCATRDALLQPVRRLSKTTHFRKVKGPSRDDPSIMVDDLLTPCGAEEPGAIEMNWMEIDANKLIETPVTMEDILWSLGRQKPTVTEEELEKHAKFQEDFG